MKRERIVATALVVTCFSLANYLHEADQDTEKYVSFDSSPTSVIKRTLGGLMLSVGRNVVNVQLDTPTEGIYSFRAEDPTGGPSLNCQGSYENTHNRLNISPKFDCVAVVTPSQLVPHRQPASPNLIPGDPA